MPRYHILLDNGIDKLSEDMFTGKFKEIYIDHIKDKPVGVNTVIQFGGEGYLRIDYTARREFGELPQLTMIDMVYDTSGTRDMVENCKTSISEYTYNENYAYLNTSNLEDWELSWFSDEEITKRSLIFGDQLMSNKLIFTNIQSILNDEIRLGKLKDLQTLKYIK